MIQIIDFRRKYFEGMVDCYARGFPEGHNRYTLARLCKFQRDSIFLATNKMDQVLGVLIGITSVREAWFTALTLMPSVRNSKQVVSHLAYALSQRFIEMGFDQAHLTTKRRSILRLMNQVDAPQIIKEPNCYFDGQSRWIVTVSQSNLPKLVAMMK